MQKIGVVNIENIDEPCIQEINVFVLDFSKITNFQKVEGRFFDMLYI